MGGGYSLSAQIHNLVTVQSTVPIRLWTGQGDLVFGGETFRGSGGALSVSELELTSKEPDRRLQIILSGVSPSSRAQFIQDLGPLLVIVKWIRSADHGETWTETASFQGRLSTPNIQDGGISIEVETEKGDVDRGQAIRWSHEDQLRRYPGDLGMEHFRALSQQGIDTTWPP